MTRTEVIYALERCTCAVADACVDCPVWKEGQSDYISCRTRLLREALTLLMQDSVDLVDGIQTMREICWMHVCDDCPAAVGDSASCAFFPDHDGLSSQEVAEIVWAYQAKKRKEEKADG